MATVPGAPEPLPHVDLPATPEIDPNPYEGPTIGPDDHPHNEPVEPPEHDAPEPVEPPEIEID